MNIVTLKRPCKGTSGEVMLNSIINTMQTVTEFPHLLWIMKTS